MSALTLIPNHVPLPVDDMGQLITFLVRERGLTEADLVRLVQLQRAEELRLSEALLKLRLATPADIEAARLLGAETRPDAAGVASQQLLFVRDPFHLAAEQVRSLRTEILQRQPDKAHNRFAVVSSNAGDGRSRLAATLALACAQLGQATLLIDADLRRPSQHELFGIPFANGLTDTLERGLPPRVVGVQGHPHLAVLPAGTPASQPLELLCSKPFVDLLEGFRHRYRHVIIDTPAAERGADAVAIASAAGVALTVARLDHSALPKSAELLKRLKSASVHVLGGAVLKTAL